MNGDAEGAFSALFLNWPEAALDVLQFRARFTSFVDSDTIDDGLKEAAREQSAQMVSTLRDLSPEHRELLYAELGDEAAAVRSLVDS